jgi:plasmid stability protein
MTDFTIEGLEDWEMAALAARAAKANRSVEEEARLILTAAVEDFPERPEPSSIPGQG